MSESPRESLSELVEKSVTAPHPISINFFSRRTSRAVKLVENGDPENFIKGQNREFSFDFDSPVFVRSIEVHTEGYGDYDYCDFSWHSIRKKNSVSDARRNSKGLFSIAVNDVVEGFSFKPGKKYFGDPKITKVVVVGLMMSELDKALSELGSVDEYRSKIVGICEQKVSEADMAEERVSLVESREQELAESIRGLEEEKNLLESSIEKLAESRANLKEEVKGILSEITGLKNDSAKLSDLLDEKIKNSKILNDHKVALEQELKGLKSDINLFPTEISAFVSQGASNISRYMLLAFLPIVVLFYVTWYVFDSAAGFASAYSSYGASEMVAVLLSRMPFMVVSLGIISASYKIASLFISEIIKINNQRLALSKISIIAKDVSEASERGICLDERELYELRTKLKMDLLKSHLKGYVDDAYTYPVDPKLDAKVRSAESGASKSVEEVEGMA